MVGKRRKRETIVDDNDDEVIQVDQQISTTKKRGNDTTGAISANGTSTKTRQARFDLSTPTKSKKGLAAELPVRNADRSARRKSARRLIEQTAAAESSGDDELGQEENLAQRIWEDERDEAENEEPAGRSGDEEQGHEPTVETPSKRPRGRPKGWRKQRTPTPPGNLPAHEHYFFQNRPGGAKTSNNTLSGLSLISHEDYFTTMDTYKDPHEPEQDFLHSFHSRSFDQWIFELSQGFNICLYGFGSKRELLDDFAAHLSAASPDTKIVVVNGYNAALNVRQMLNTISSTIPSLTNTKLPAPAPEATTVILRALTASPPPKPTVLLLHTLDGPMLRRPASQSVLSRLAASPHMHLLASADTPNFPLLWDATLATRFNWLFHDTTTFQPYDVEISGGAGAGRAGGGGGVVDEVNALLGRSGRKMQGREGVMYVLKSLTANARSLYALLVAELLAMEDEEDEDDGAKERSDDEDEANDGDDHYGDDGFNDTIGRPADQADDGDFAEPNGGGSRGRARKGAGGGGRRSGGGAGLRRTIEYHSLYTKAMAQLITTNEVNYRGLLKEFYDHEMVVSRKDALGAEVLGVPFRREEMELLLTELMGS